MWAFILSSWAAQVAASVVFHVVADALVGKGVEAELQNPNGVFRPMSSVLMLYPLLGAPLANAAILYAVREALGMRVHDAATGVWLAACVWAIGSGHGIFIQWTSVKVSVRATAHFAASTFVLACVNGWMLARFGGA